MMVKKSKRPLPYFGNWIATGIFQRVGGGWVLERDYFYAPYWEFFSICENSLTVYSYDFVLGYEITPHKDKIDAQPPDCFGYSTQKVYYYPAFSGPRLYLMLVNPEKKGYERLWILKRTLIVPGLEPDEQNPKAMKRLAATCKINWLQKEEHEKVGKIRFPGFERDYGIYG